MSRVRRGCPYGGRARPSTGSNPETLLERPTIGRSSCITPPTRHRGRVEGVREPRHIWDAITCAGRHVEHVRHRTWNPARRSLPLGRPRQRSGRFHILESDGRDPRPPGRRAHLRPGLSPGPRRGDRGPRRQPAHRPAPHPGLRRRRQRRARLRRERVGHRRDARRSARRRPDGARPRGRVPPGGRRGARVGAQRRPGPPLPDAAQPRVDQRRHGQGHRPRRGGGARRLHLRRSRRAKTPWVSAICCTPRSPGTGAAPRARSCRSRPTGPDGRPLPPGQLRPGCRTTSTRSPAGRCTCRYEALRSR